MSARVRPRSKSEETKGNRAANQPAAAVAVQKLHDEQPQQKEATPESQDIIPDKEKAVAEAPMDHGEAPDLEAHTQKLPLPKTEDISEGDTAVKGADFPTVEPVKMPEAGEGQCKV